jgi:hypothetical protein
MIFYNKDLGINWGICIYFFSIPKSLIFKNFNHKKNLKKKKKKKIEENMKSHTHTNIEPNTTVGEKKFI